MLSTSDEVSAVMGGASLAYLPACTYVSIHPAGSRLGAPLTAAQRTPL
jgi:hypothetical protein